MAASKFVEITIQGQSFKVKAETGAYFQELASYVEGVMEEVKRQSGAPTSHRIAIMAALDIADTLFVLRKQVEGDSQFAHEKVSNLIELSDGLLKG